MFSHVTIGSNDLDRSRRFYDVLLGSIGAQPGMAVDLYSPRIVYSHDGALFIVVQPLDGKDATPANGGTIGFRLDSPETVDNFHATALAQGGTTCEDPPGIRETPFGPLYLAYLRDPDGNKLCAFHNPGA